MIGSDLPPGVLLKERVAVTEHLRHRVLAGLKPGLLLDLDKKQGPAGVLPAHEHDVGFAALPSPKTR